MAPHSRPSRSLPALRSGMGADTAPVGSTRGALTTRARAAPARSAHVPAHARYSQHNGICGHAAEKRAHMQGELGDGRGDAAGRFGEQSLQPWSSTTHAPAAIKLELPPTHHEQSELARHFSDLQVNHSQAILNESPSCLGYLLRCIWFSRAERLGLLSQGYLARKASSAKRSHHSRRSPPQASQYPETTCATTCRSSRCCRHGRQTCAQGHLVARPLGMSQARAKPDVTFESLTSAPQPGPWMLEWLARARRGCFVQGSRDPNGVPCRRTSWWLFGKRTAPVTPQSNEQRKERRHKAISFLSHHGFAPIVKASLLESRYRAEAPHAQAS